MEKTRLQSLVSVITNRYDGKEKLELVANVDGFHPKLVLDVFHRDGNHTIAG